MAAPFVLSIQTALRPPTNVKSVANQIASQLGNLDIGLSKQSINDIAKAEANLRSLGTTTKRVTSEFKILGKAAAETFQRFFGFTIIISQMYAAAGAIKSATAEAIDFDKELLKIKQVSGASADEIKSLSLQVSNLAKNFGVSSKELLSASQIFTQAGLSIEDTKIAINTIALTDLSPTFKNMANSAEAAIAIMSQFKLEAKDLAGAFESIDAVSAKFAVEAEDLNTVIRRTGGAFEAAGGSLNELLALFTSVRATTRESAESIATALRTIFARLQRPKTQTFLETLGITTADNGEFKGPLEAIKQISNAVKDLPKNDIRFAGLVEELGGVRQLSKVIPLIKEYGLAQEALIVAETAQGRLAINAQIAQQSLANQMTKTKESFLDLVRTMSSSDAFKFLANTTLKLSSGILDVSTNLKDLIPLLIAVGGALSLKRVVQFTEGFTDRLGFGAGGQKGLSLSKGTAAIGGGAALALPLLSTFGQLDDESKKLVNTFAGLGAQLFAVQTTLSFLSKDTLERKTSQTATAKLNLTDVESQITDVSTQRDKFLSARDNAVKTRETSGNTVIDAQNKLDKENQKLTALKKNLVTRQLIGTSLPLTDDEKDLIKQAKFNVSKTNGKIRTQKAIVSKVDADIAARPLTALDARLLPGGAVEQRAEAQRRIDDLRIKRNAQKQKAVALEDKINQRNLGPDVELLKTKIQDSASKVKNLKTVKNVAEGVRVTSEAQAIELQTALDSKQARVTELLERKKMLRKEIDANNRLVRQTELAIVGVSVLSTLAAGAGQFLAQAGRSQLENGNAGGRNSFIGGSALQLAGTGAGLGAALGTAIAPGVGTAVGAGVGGAIGFGAGLITGAQEAERILENVRFTKATTELTNILKDVSLGRSNPLFNAGTVTGRITELRRSLREAGPEDKADRLSAIGNQITGITDFANQIAKTSANLEEFKQRLSPEVFDFLVDFGGTTVKKLDKQFQDLIDSTTRLKNVDEEFIRLQERQFERLVEVNNFTSAIEDSVSSIEQFNSTLNGTSFGGRSNVFNRNTSSANFGKAVDQTLSPFGAAGSQLAKEAKAVQGVAQQLPNILLKLSKSDPFGAGSDFNDKLRSELSEIPAFIREAIVNQADAIIGGDEKDAKIIDAITHDLSGTVNKLTAGFNELLQPLSKINESITSFTNGLIDLSNQANEFSSQARGTRLQGVDIREQKARFSASFADTAFVNNGEFERVRRNQVLDFGPGSIPAGEITPSDLADEARIQRESIQESRLALQDTTDVAARTRLIKEINKQEEALAKANEGLNFLSDSAARTAAPLEELARLKAVRENRADLTKQIIFGDTDTRRSIRRNLAGAAQLGRTGDINSIPASDRQGVLSILEKFGNDKRFGGLTGKEVIQKTADGLGLGDEFRPALDEIAKSIEVQSAFDTAIKANNLKGLSLEQQSVALLSRIDTNTAMFVKQTNDNLRASQFKQEVGKQQNLLASSQSLGAQIGTRDKLVEDLLPTGRKFDNKGLSDLKNNLTTLQELKNINDRKREGQGAKIVLNDRKEFAGQLTTLRSIGFTPNELIKNNSTRNPGGIGAFGQESLQKLNTELSEKISPEFAKRFSVELEKNIKEGKIGLNDKGAVASGIFGASGQSNVDALLRSELQKLSRQSDIDVTTFDEKTRQVRNNLGITDVNPLLALLPKLEQTFKSLPDNMGKIDEQFQETQRQLAEVNKSIATNFKPELFEMFNATVNRFADLKNMSLEIAGSQKVEVIFNGAEVFNTLQPVFTNLIEVKIGKAINDLLKTKFPGVGGFNPPKEAPNLPLET